MKTAAAIALWLAATATGTALLLVVICGALHLGEPSRAKRPIKTIRNNHHIN